METLTCHCGMCCNPTNGRVDIEEYWASWFRMKWEAFLNQSNYKNYIFYFSKSIEFPYFSFLKQSNFNFSAHTATTSAHLNLWRSARPSLWPRTTSTKDFSQKLKILDKNLETHPGLLWPWNQVKIIKYFKDWKIWFYFHSYLNDRL